MSSWNVILDAGKPVVLDENERKFPRYTHIFYRYGVCPINGGFLAYADEESQRAALKRYPGAELKLLVTCANENYEWERFRPDLNGVEFEKRRITPALSHLIVKQLDETKALTYAAFEAMRLP